MLLTYTAEPSKDDYKRLLEKFLRDIRRECRKNKIDFKRVAVTERIGTRIHHHIVCNNIPIDMVKNACRTVEYSINLFGTIPITPTLRIIY